MEYVTLTTSFQAISESAHSANSINYTTSAYMLQATFYVSALSALIAAAGTRNGRD